MDGADNRLMPLDSKPHLSGEIEAVDSSKDRAGTQRSVKGETEANINDIMMEMMQSKGGEALGGEATKSTEKTSKPRFLKGHFTCSYTKKSLLKASTLKPNSKHKKIHDNLNDGIQRRFVKKTAAAWTQVAHNPDVSSIKLTHACRNEPIEISPSRDLERAGQKYQQVKAISDEKKAKLNELKQRLKNLEKRPDAEKLAKFETLKRIKESIETTEKFLLKIDNFAQKCEKLGELGKIEKGQLDEERKQLLQEYKEIGLKQTLNTKLGQTIRKIDNSKFVGAKLVDSIEKLLNVDFLAEDIPDLSDLIDEFGDKRETVKSKLTPYVQQYQEALSDIKSTCPPYMVHFLAFTDGDVESFSLFVNELEQAINRTKGNDLIAYQDALMVLSDAFKFIQETGLFGLTRRYQNELLRKDENTILQQSDYEILQSYVNNLQKLLALTPDSIQQPTVDDEEDFDPLEFGIGEASEKDSSPTSENVSRELPGGEELLDDSFPVSPSTPPSTATVTKAPLMEEKFKTLLALIPSDDQEVTVQEEVTVREIRSKLIGFNQSKEGLVNAFRVYQNHINEALKAIKQETDQKGALEKQAEKLMKELIQHKQEKDQCLVGFIKLLESERGVSIEELFQKDIQEIQEFADLFLGHYLTHSQERFPKLFKTHQDFAERVAEMFILLEKQILPGDLQELKLLLTDFLNRHIKLEDKKAKESSETETVSNTAKKSNAEPAKPLYRKVQAAHEADSDLLNECNMISEKLQKVLPWLFGKGFAVSPEAAHLVPYPGVVSWDLNYLSQLFKQRLGVTLNLEADRLALFNQNVKPFAETVQAGEKIDPETVKMELKTRLSLDSNITRDENFTFIFNTLVFLTHLSSLEMAETRHLPEYFNQVVDKYSETEIKYENSQGRGYKVLLGEALIDLINSPDSSQLSEKHITYLKSTLEAVSGRLKELADKKEATHKLTSLELVECHALYSIYLAVKKITEEKNLDQSILEKEKLIEASAEKITA